MTDKEKAELIVGLALIQGAYTANKAHGPLEGELCRQS